MNAAWASRRSWLRTLIVTLVIVGGVTNAHGQRKTAPGLSGEGGQSCDNDRGPTVGYQIPCCDCYFGVWICTWLQKVAQAVGLSDGTQDQESYSPLGVRLEMSQGFSSVIDSGTDGFGSLPAGCGSCGAGGSIPATSQMLRFWLPRFWRSTWTHDGSLGRGMYTGFDYYVLRTSAAIEFRDPITGITQRFVQSGGSYIPAPGVKYRYLVSESSATHLTIRQPGGLKLRFEITNYVQSGAGNRCRLEYVEDPQGNRITFSYTLPATNTTANVMKWASAADPYERTTTFTYTIFNGLNVLDLVTFPDNRTVRYLYTGNNSRFVHKIEYGVGGVASGIESTWHVGSTIKVNEALMPPDHYLWEMTVSEAAFGRARAIQRFDGSYVFARSVTDDGNSVTTTTTWSKNVVTEVKRSASQQLISSRTQRLDGSWDSNIAYSAENYLPTTAYDQPADGDVPARVTSVVRDGATDMVTRRNYSDGTVEHYQYNALNQMTQYTDRLGNITEWEYDAGGNLEKHTVAVGTALEAFEEWTYNGQGQILSYKDFNGNETEYEYYPAMHASQFELHKVILPSGTGQPAGEVVYTYDAAGRVATVTDPAGRTATFAYDAAGRHTQTTYADTSTETTTYGTGALSARVLETKDRNGNRSVLSYDATGRVQTSEVREAVTNTLLTSTTRTFDFDTGHLTSIDTDGDVSEYEYDYQNRLIKTTTHPSSTKSLVSESVFNRYRRTTSIDPYGRTTSYTYDNLNRVLSTTQELIAGGATITSSTEYDNQGNVQASIDPNGNRTEYTYDDRNRRTSTTVAVGTPVEATSSVEYDDNSNVVKRIDARSNEWLTSYTVRNRTLTSTDPESGVTSYTYTADSMVATVTNANGHTTTNTYDTCCARLEKVTDADSFFTSFEYDPNGNRTQVTDQADRVVTYEYDGLNRMTKQTSDPGGLDIVTSVSYDRNAGNIGTSSTTVNPAGQSVTRHLDGIGRTRLVDGDTTKVTYEYDEVVAMGADAGLLRTTTHVDPDNLNITTSALTDGAGRTIKSFDALDHAVVFTYDDNGNVLTATDRDGKVTTNLYDERDRLVSSTADTGGIAAVTTYIYDANSNLTQLTDPESKVSQFSYDDANRRLTTTYAHGTADQRTWATEYWPLGQVKKLTKPDGITIEYAYDDVERLEERVYKNGMATLGTDTLSYHPNGLLSTAHGGLYNTDIDRSVLNDDYDEANRLVEERLDIGDGDKPVAYEYTTDSLVSQITYPGGTVMNRTYNTRRLLHEVKLGGTTQATQTYDTASRRTGRAYVNDTAVTWGYDLNSRTTTLSHATTGMMPTVFQTWDYRYTDAGNPLVQDDVTPSLSVHGEAYQYDGLHRLANYQSGTVSGNTVPTPTAYQDWTLSKLGNWTAWDNDGTNETRTHNNINALTARSTVANALTYDANFNQTDDGDQFTYEYDANDKLKIVRNRTTTAVVAEYRYDALGRRVEKEVGANITRYYHSGERILEERNGSDAVTATYTYGTYIDEPLTMDRDSERFYYHANRMYSVYALTDSAGDLIERYSYTPYGVTTTYDDAYANPQPTSRVDNPFTYTGRELDSETLLMYYRARTYDPAEGRFKQLDPIGLRGGLNLYRYTSNSPLAYLDPLGLEDPKNSHELLKEIYKKNNFPKGLLGIRNNPESVQAFRSTARLGCVGNVACSLGRPVWDNKGHALDLSYCFLDYPTAKAWQKVFEQHKTCCSQGEKNLDGDPRKPRIVRLEFSRTGADNLSNHTKLLPGEEDKVDPNNPGFITPGKRAYDMNADWPEINDSDSEAMGGWNYDFSLEMPAEDKWIGGTTGIDAPKPTDDQLKNVNVVYTDPRTRPTATQNDPLGIIHQSLPAGVIIEVRFCIICEGDGTK